MRYYILLLLGLFSLIADAQIFTSAINEQELKFKVKQIDEFIQRFNLECDYEGRSFPAELGKEERMKNMLTLFNLDIFVNQNHEIDSLAYAFLEYVIDKGRQIHYEDTTWNAEAMMQIEYNNSKYNLSIFLQTERIENVMFKWVISDIQSPLFDSISVMPEHGIMVSPAEHGINFITLPNLMNLNKSHLQTLFRKGYEVNRLSVFDFLMKTNQIKLSNIPKIVYHFHLDTYDFDVERVEKQNSYNQGWLINSINHIKDK